MIVTKGLTGEAEEGVEERGDCEGDSHTFGCKKIPSSAKCGIPISEVF